MSHGSGPGTIVIDCETEDLGDAPVVRTTLLGAKVEIVAGGTYAVPEDQPGAPPRRLPAVDRTSTSRRTATRRGRGASRGSPRAASAPCATGS